MLFAVWALDFKHTIVIDQAVWRETEQLVLGREEADLLNEISGAALIR